MKKRVIIYLMAIAVTLGGVVGCSSNEKDDEAIKVLNDALEKTNAETSNSGTMNMDMSIEGEDASMSIAFDFIMNHIDNPETMEAEMTMNMTVLDETQEITMYMKDGNMYASSNGTIQRIETGSLDDYTEQVALEDFEMDQVESAKIRNDGSDQIITVKLDQETINEIILGNLEENLSEIGLSEEDVVIEDYTLEYVVNEEGYIYKQNISFTMTMTMQDQEITMDASMDIEYTSFDVEEIDFPDFSTIE